MAFLEGKRGKEMFQEWKSKVLPTFILGSCFWNPAQAINFRMIPPKYRVTFIGGLTFIELNFLCLFRRIDFDNLPRPWWTRTLDPPDLVKLTVYSTFWNFLFEAKEKRQCATWFSQRHCVLNTQAQYYDISALQLAYVTCCNDNGLGSK